MLYFDTQNSVPKSPQLKAHGFLFISNSENAILQVDILR